MYISNLSTLECVSRGHCLRHQLDSEIRWSDIQIPSPNCPTHNSRHPLQKTHQSNNLPLRISPRLPTTHNLIPCRLRNRLLLPHAPSLTLLLLARPPTLLLDPILRQLHRHGLRPLVLAASPGLLLPWAVFAVAFLVCQLGL